MQHELEDFSPEQIEEKKKESEDDAKIMEHLSKKTAKELMEGLNSNGGHPKPEWKNKETDETWRYYYMDECSRRGLKLYEELGWPSNKESLYVNLHTGGVEELYNVITWDGTFAERNTIANHCWAVIENWEPYDPNKPNEYLIKYLEEEIKRLQSLKDGPPVSYENKTAEHRAQLSKNLLECRIKLDKELTKRGKNGDEKCS